MSEQQQTMRDRLRLPDAPPPRLNHVVVTGALAEEPRLGRNPIGEPVTLLRVGFPVADPMRPQTLLTWATVEVEVPDPLADRQDIRELQGGAPILAAGQLSERWSIADGRSTKRGAIIAAHVHPGPTPGAPKLFLPGEGP
ncbi:MAG TPA: hypothetical protein VFW48_05385 [Solirubrobacterales bacterium]|nr:hypothetical protein [Solirubrobacterales bacterium]